MLIHKNVNPYLLIYSVTFENILKYRQRYSETLVSRWPVGIKLIRFEPKPEMCIKARRYFSQTYTWRKIYKNIQAVDELY